MDFPQPAWTFGAFYDDLSHPTLGTHCPFGPGFPQPDSKMTPSHLAWEPKPTEEKHPR